MPPGAIGRAREALRHGDFRRLFGLRLASQCGDGLFQASLVASFVFSPERADTALRFAIATLVVALPYSLLGPFAGVFIDRWSRRKILLRAPWLRAAAVWLVLADPDRFAVPFFAGALFVLSTNRFYLSTASAVVPRLVPTADLLVANSMASVGGTFATLVGVFVGGKVAEAVGPVAVLGGAAGLWVFASWFAWRIQNPLVPHTIPEARVRDELGIVVHDFADGIRRLVRTPRAVGPITSLTLDQIGQGFVLVLSMVVLRDRFGEGVGSFSNLVGAGGIGVVLGILTVGWLEGRFRKERIVAGAFAVGGAVLLGVSLRIEGWTMLAASFAIGLTYAWKKIATDTIVQSSLPDGYRGRVFTVYDVGFNLARVAAGFLAVPLQPALGDAGSVAVVGLLFLLWSPVLPRWLARAPQIHVDLEADIPVRLRWGDVEEPVTVRHAWTGAGGRRCFRLALQDGTVVDVSGDGAGWSLDRELRS
ncbi:MAG: MFS transporter [Actinomycetota bacterium]